MSIRNATFGILVCLFTFGTAQSAVAGDRELWKFDGGFFIKLKGNRWQETSKTSDDKFHFVETARTDEYVEIYDKGRDLTIRLRKKMCTIQTGKSNKFEKLYDGGWAD